jgi:hypothetical protein
VTNEEVIRAEKSRAKLLAFFRQWVVSNSLKRRRVGRAAVRFLGTAPQEAVLEAETMLLEGRKNGQ